MSPRHRYPASAFVARALLASALMAAFSGPAAAQPLPPRRPHTVSRWTAVDGLPGNIVRNLAQAADGQLVILSSGILVRFDGKGFAPLDLAPGPPSVGGGGTITRRATMPQFPLQIARGGGDTIWVATSTGRLIARSRGAWGPAMAASGGERPPQAVEMVAQPGVTPVVRTAVPTPALWQGAKRLATPWMTNSDDPYTGDRIGFDSTGTLWTLDGAGTAARSIAPPGPQPGAARNPATLPVATGHLVQRGDGRGILGVRRVNGRLEIVDAAGAVRTIVPDAAGLVPRLLTRDGRLLVTSRAGVEIHRADGTPPERVPLSIAATTGTAGVRINAVLEDRDGGIWLGTDGLGLIQLRPSYTRTFLVPDAAPGARQVRSVTAGQGGSVIALAGDVLYRITRDRVTRLDVRRTTNERDFNAAAEDSDGALWVSLLSSPGEGTVLVQPSDGATRRYRRPALAVKFVEDTRRGEMLWLEADDLCRAPLRTAGSAATSAPSCTPLGPWGARDLLVARDGTIWIAGEAGVRAESAAGVRIYSDSTGYPLGLARALHEDADGTIWIGTYRSGLVRLTRTPQGRDSQGRDSQGRDSLVRITSRDGLAEDVVSTILEDSRGMLWMGGNRGIHAVARDDIASWLAGRLRRLPSLRVDHREGLVNAEGSGWSGARDAAGVLWFPTFGGAVGIDPLAQYPRTAIAPPTVIDGVRSGDLSFTVNDTVSLPVGVRRLEVDAGAVRLQAPDDRHLEYQLEGHTDGWAAADGPHQLQLAGVRPGRWRLDVRTVSPLMSADESIASLVLDVPATFRESVWYQLLLAVVTGALLVAGIAVRTRWLSRRATTLQREVERQTHLVREERDRTEAALVQATQMGGQLRDLLTSKSRVFASLSHELRTPMSLIIGPLHELEREADGQFPPVARGHLGAISTAVRRLQRLTSQFLDLADTQSGTLRLVPQRIDVAAFVQQCVDQLAPLAALRGVQITRLIPAGAPIEADLDPDQMDKVVTNLVTNAIRHAPEGGEVRVRVDYADGDGSPQWTLTVSDDGHGVPPELGERIFEPFFQAPGATEGMGLGLALSRDVVTLHRGRIQLVPGEAGATFAVRLPCHARPGGRATPGRGATAIPAEGRSTPPARTVEDRAKAPTEERERGRGRVLVVEDDAALCAFLAEQLGVVHEVRTAASGEDALAVLREWPADAIVSDVVMPGIDGIALCRILKADPNMRNTPIVLLTARGSREDQVAGLSAGADDYLIKPFDPEQLRLKVDNLIRLRRNIEDRFRRALPAWSSILLRAGTEQLDRPSEQFLERLFGVLVPHIPDQTFDVEQLARELHVSRASLYRRVKELLDTTPLDLLQSVRLEHAALLLRTEDDTIASIAHRTGFKWAQTFTVRFTAHFGMTPSAYRTLQRAAGIGAGAT
ncbi:MAG: response regulator [Gemmatimonadota bacterium]|nr:response regulator [Gemmatimonadota bacterium]